ncbi:Phage integrase [Neorhizobium galegae bv. officinalis bv. officinalis str. HAMBI 1141]|uniref:Phage integrase n=1 Tax=Neorhizobium galegae bv. officinalis bv. officinalis str. HAMBI 1141 TaxID=1028801 RepID=A0A068T389_NEOGA|nr:Phage integrase [Neorhizobium galegae bv. officinalis bv. officinalis str. HAMBI 1141]
MRTDRPGYQCRPRKDGTPVHYWNPQRAVKGASKSLSIIRLPDESTDEQITAECQRLTNQLRAEVRKAGAEPVFDGTIKSLIDRYRHDKTSSWHSVKHSTRIRDYEPSLRVLTKNVGDRDINVLRGSDFNRWFSQWRKKGHRRASGAMKLLRIILSYGAGERLRGCKQARDILSDMRFELPASRDVAMTYDQCLAIVKMSAELKCPSIGFVEALKFESALRRIDVIGEWAPPEEGGAFRWRGPTAQSLSKDLILKLKTSKNGAEVARDLNAMPLVAEALKSYTIPEIGPIVIDEDHGKPYWENRYTEKFRKVRDKAGVPANVWSMDSRAGAVSETVEATGSLALASELATHSTTKMTKKYSRGDGLETSRRIAEARTANRLSATAVKQ